MNSDMEEQMESIAMPGANENCYGKVRYVGGWVVAKLIHCHKSYIKTFLLIQYASPCRDVRTECLH